MKYGGSGSKDAAELSAQESAKLLQAKLESAKQIRESTQSMVGQMVQGGQLIEQNLARKEAMTQQTAMQEREIQARAGLSAQESQQRITERGEAAVLEGRAKPPEGGAAPAGGMAPGAQGPPAPTQLPGQVSTERPTGRYTPTSLEKEKRVMEFNYLNAQRTALMAEVKNKSEITRVHLDQMQAQMGEARAETERKAYVAAQVANDKLYEVETDAAKAMTFEDTALNPQKVKILQQQAGEARAQREAFGFQYLVGTGDDSFMIPGSPSHKELNDRWVPIARDTLNSSGALKRIAARLGPRAAKRMVNQGAAQLMYLGALDPDLQQAAMMAFGQQQAPGNVPGPTSQPGR